MVNVKLLKALRPKMYEAIVESYGDKEVHDLKASEVIEIEKRITSMSATELLDTYLQYEGIIGYTNDILRAVSASLAATKENLYSLKFEPETFNPEDYIEQVSERLGLTIDFPNCFYVPLDDAKHLVFGYANRSLGYNLVDNETGEVFDSGELDDSILIESQTIDNQVSYIKNICEKYHAELL